MKVDAKEILVRLKKEDRIRKTIYISETVYDEFQKTCGAVGVSPVLEELMRQFIESAKGKNKQ
jgi:predicted CopG family antitoxin